MAVTETADGVDLAACSAPSAGDLVRAEEPASHKTRDPADDDHAAAIDGLPTLRPHHDASAASGFLVEDQGFHRASDRGSAELEQRPDGVAGGGVEGSKRELRDLEDLLSKLNPMAEEFVPPSIAGNRQAAFDGASGVAFGGGLYANGFGASQDFETGGANGDDGSRKKNGFGQAKRRMNNRTSLAQREEVIRRTVYVADIDHQVTEEDLAALFINCGQVVDCRMCGDPKTVLRFAFIEFTDEEGARTALNLSGTMLGFYPVRVLPSKTAIAPVNPTFLPRSDDEREMCSRTIYCTNIDKKVSQADVRLFFESICGEVYRLRLLGDYHHSTRIAFVEFVMAESATAALNCSGVVLGSLPIRSEGNGAETRRLRMECVVQGIIETQHVEALEILLQGLCGVPKERIRVHELCLKSGPSLAVPSEFRLLCDLAQPTPSWTVRHVGGAMRGAGAEQISVLVRTMVESKVSNNALRFFYSLGYKLDHELLKIGFAFRFQRGAPITVTVTSANKMPKLHATDEAVPVTPGIQMVEITAPTAGDNYNEVGAAVSSFCEYLAPLLHLSKPGVSTGIVPTAAAAAASLLSNSGGKAIQ
ncbi:unnamed protein product [Musa textilis]